MKDIICAAINDGKLIEFGYKGGQRLVEPYILGLNSVGRAVLSGWQVDGGSGASWRKYFLDEMASIVATDAEFHTARPGYNPHDKSIHQVICSF